jgi:hypothetical protein
LQHTTEAQQTQVVEKASTQLEQDFAETIIVTQSWAALSQSEAACGLDTEIDVDLADLFAVRRLKFFLRLHYPVQITVGEDGFVGRYPDLPGCECQHADVGSLYASLEQTRQGWLSRQILSGLDVPLPNAYLRASCDLPISDPSRRHAGKKSLVQALRRMARSRRRLRSAQD